MWQSKKENIWAYFENYDTVKTINTTETIKYLSTL